MYAVQQWQGDGRQWAEYEDGLPVIHRTEAGARAAFDRMVASEVPPGTCPSVWGLTMNRIQRCPNVCRLIS